MAKPSSISLFEEGREVWQHSSTVSPLNYYRSFSKPFSVRKKTPPICQKHTPPSQTQHSISSISRKSLGGKPIMLISQESEATSLGRVFYWSNICYPHRNHFPLKKKKKTGKGGAAAVPGRGPAASSGPACLRSRHPRAKDGCGPSELASRAVAASRPESRVLPDSHFHPRSRRPGPRAGSFKPPPRPPRPRLSPAPRGTRRVTAPLA